MDHHHSHTQKHTRSPTQTIPQTPQQDILEWWARDSNCWIVPKKSKVLFPYFVIDEMKCSNYQTLQLSHTHKSAIKFIPLVLPFLFSYNYFIFWTRKNFRWISLETHDVIWIENYHNRIDQRGLCMTEPTTTNDPLTTTTTYVNRNRKSNFETMNLLALRNQTYTNYFINSLILFCFSDFCTHTHDMCMSLWFFETFYSHLIHSLIHSLIWL